MWMRMCVCDVCVDEDVLCERERACAHVRRAPCTLVFVRPLEELMEKFGYTSALHNGAWSEPSGAAASVPPPTAVVAAPAPSLPPAVLVKPDRGVPQPVLPPMHAGLAAGDALASPPRKPPAKKPRTNSKRRPRGTTDVLKASAKARARAAVRQHSSYPWSGKPVQAVQARFVDPRVLVEGCDASCVYLPPCRFCLCCRRMEIHFRLSEVGKGEPVPKQAEPETGKMHWDFLLAEMVRGSLACVRVFSCELTSFLCGRGPAPSQRWMANDFEDEKRAHRKHLKQRCAGVIQFFQARHTKALRDARVRLRCGTAPHP